MNAITLCPTVPPSSSLNGAYFDGWPLFTNVCLRFVKKLITIIQTKVQMSVIVLRSYTLPLKMLSSKILLRRQ